MKHTHRTKRQARKGQSIMLVMLALVILCIMAALTVDYGLMVIRANQLQRACDAAALTAAWSYYNDYVKVAGTINSNQQKATLSATAETTAKSQAVTVADSNGVTITSSNVTFNGTVGSNNPRRVTVVASGSHSYFIARVMGAGSSVMTRRATAEITPVAGIGKSDVDGSSGGVAPLGITVDDFKNYYNSGSNLTVTLERLQTGDFTNGEILGMDIRPQNGKSPSQWEDEVATGADLNFYSDNPSNTAINASRGNQSGRLQNAINTRIANGQKTLYIMVTDPRSQNNGTSNMPLRGVAKVEIQSISLNGQGNNALASFTMKVVGGWLDGDSNYITTVSSVDVDSLEGIPSSEINNNENTNFMFTVRLIDDI
ncbi:MAG: pilus assembly protein TadG-related protein [Candidatus Methylacidiphilales bacterium]|nr:pilus assembly protein TadG-related protein [Candidatus Methylacidiphilales bacterium]